MKLRALLRVRFRALLAMFGQQKKGNSNGVVVGITMGILLLVLLAFFSVSFYGLSLVYRAQGLDWLYFALAGLFSLAMGVLGTVFSTQNQLYAAKDNDLMLSLPLRPGEILLGRIIPLLTMTAAFCWVVLLPAGCCYALTGGFRLARWRSSCWRCWRCRCCPGDLLSAGLAAASAAVQDEPVGGIDCLYGCLLRAVLLVYFQRIGKTGDRADRKWAGHCPDHPKLGVALLRIRPGRLRRDPARAGLFGNLRGGCGYHLSAAERDLPENRPPEPQKQAAGRCGGGRSNPLPPSGPCFAGRAGDLSARRST